MSDENQPGMMRPNPTVEVWALVVLRGPPAQGRALVDRGVCLGRTQWVA